MVKRYTRLILLLLAGGTGTGHTQIIVPSIAPSILNSGGSSIAAGGYVWELNFGELMAISTVSGPNVIVTQGLLQPTEGSVILPVTLVRFQGVKMDRHNQLSWTTGHESGSTKFELERSSDARNFNIVYTTPSRGVANGSTYSYNDYQPFSGKVYYRLRITDAGGTINYSQIVVLYDYEKSYWAVYPNPVLRGNPLQVSLQNADAATKATIIMLDAAGRKVYESKQQLVSGFQTISLPVQVPPGLYTLSVAGFLTNTSQKIIVK